MIVLDQIRSDWIRLDPIGSDLSVKNTLMYEVCTAAEKISVRPSPQTEEYVEKTEEEEV